MRKFLKMAVAMTIFIAAATSGLQAQTPVLRTTFVEAYWEPVDDYWVVELQFSVTGTYNLSQISGSAYADFRDLVPNSAGTYPGWSYYYVNSTVGNTTNFTVCFPAKYDYATPATFDIVDVFLPPNHNYKVNIPVYFPNK